MEWTFVEVSGQGAWGSIGVLEKGEYWLLGERDQGRDNSEFGNGSYG